MRRSPLYYVGLTLFVKSPKSGLNVNESVIVLRVYKRKKRTMLDVVNGDGVTFLDRNSIHFRFKKK